MPFRVIPVLDIKSGRAVHAIAGHRDNYRPLESVLHPSADVISLARALRHQLGRRPLYLADLDAISGDPPHSDIVRELLSIDLELWIDAGMRDASSFRDSLASDNPNQIHVAGLETLGGPADLASIIKTVGPGRVILSLDLFHGAPRIAFPDRWSQPQNPLELARQAIDLGICRLILLDIARVGTGRGTGTTELASTILYEYPHLELTVGGGITRISELADCKALGIASVLIGSALHDGRITAANLALLEECPP